MATLAQVTRKSRIILKFLGAAIAIVSVIFIVIGAGIFIKNALFPSPPPPPEQKFGKLPEIVFSSPKPNITFEINTVSGELPNFPDRMVVYKFVSNSPSLASLSDARSKVANLKLDNNETRLTNSLYQWESDNGDVIQYDIFSNDFKFVASTFFSNSAPDKEKALASSLSFLTALGENKEDIDLSKSSYSFYLFRGGQFEGVDSQSQATYTRVDLFQKDIDGYPIFYSLPFSSSMHFIVDEKASIVEADFKHHIVDKEQSSTYPIISASDAYTKLKEGKAAIFDDSNSSQIDITSIYLGYFIGNNGQKYMLPIAIFEGKNFIAYVPLIPDSSLNKNE